jgi:hypothetical protein
MLGHEADKPLRLFLQEMGGEPRPLGPDGLRVTGDALSPDGSVVAATSNGKSILVPLDGSAVRELGGLGPSQAPLAWTSDGKSLFVANAPTVPLVIQRYELSSQKLEKWRSLEPPDPAGILELGRVSIARDGEVYVYESYRLLSDLYVIEHLR